MQPIQPRPRRQRLGCVLRRTAILAVVAAAAGLIPLSASAQTTGIHLSPTGSDARPCTPAEPCRTTARGQAVANAGQTIWLHAGAYNAEGRSTGFGKARITWSGVPGEARPRLLGKSVISGTGQRFTRVIFDGPTGNLGSNGYNGNSVLVDVRGDGVRIDHSEVRDSLGHAGIYVSHGAEWVAIDHNWIHDNGAFGHTAFANVDHGIYWSSGWGKVTNNLIEHNYTHGIQLYPSPRAVLVANNTFVRNGRAQIMVNSIGPGPFTIANNVIALGGYNGNQPALYNYGGHTPPVTYNNLFWQNSRANTGGGSFTNVNAFVGDPQFTSGYRIGPGSAARDRGMPAYAEPDDFDDKPRLGVPDIGAFEAGGT